MGDRAENAPADAASELTADLEVNPPRPTSGGERFAAGDLLATRYRIVRMLGAGGMGEVYHAEDLLLGEPVALKTIRAHVARDEHAVERFKREIQLARKVTHANVCRIFDVGQHLPDGAGQAIVFLTMELLDGETLASSLHRDGAMKVEAAGKLVSQIAAALGAAHRAGVIHRDFKSANVMITRDGRAVVTDFGLARAMGHPGQTASGDGALAGTPAYMAPEQVEGEPVTAAADIYALGVVMYEMVTGRLPFVADTPIAMAVKRLREGPSSPSKLVPDLDPRWSEVIVRCLARNPAARVATAEEVAARLGLGAGAAPTAGASRRRRWLVAALVALVLAGGALVAWRRSLTPRAPRAADARVEGVTAYTLDNGLRVVLDPDPTRPTFSVGLTVLAGARADAAGAEGTADALEDLLAQGTPAHPHLPAELKERGGDSRDVASADFTVYLERLPADAGAANLAWVLGLEADRLRLRSFSADQVEREREVIRRDREKSAHNPREVLRVHTLAAAYRGLDYGRPERGTNPSVEALQPATLDTFARTYYRPDNAVLVVTGKLDPEKTLALIDATLGTIPRGTEAPPSRHPVAPIDDGERSLTLRAPGDEQVIEVVYRTAAASDDDFAATEALVDLLVDTPHDTYRPNQGRLYRALVGTGMATDVYGKASRSADQGYLRLVAVVPSTQPIEPVRDRMLEVIEGTGATAITDEDVEHFQANALQDFGLYLTDDGDAAYRLTRWAAIGDWRLMFIHRDRVDDLDTEAVRTAARRYLTPANRTLGLLVPASAPASEPAASRPDIATLVKDYQGHGTLPDKTFTATIDNIEKHLVRTAVGGVKLAMLAKKTPGHAVTMELKLHYGNEISLKGRRYARLALQRLLLAGTSRHSREQLADLLARLDATIAFGQGEGVFGHETGMLSVSVKTTRKNLPEVLDLLAEILQEPSFPADQFDAVKKDLLTEREGERFSPDRQLWRAILRKLAPRSPDDVRYIETTDEGIAGIRALSRDDVVSFHDTFYGMARAEVAVVGDFQPVDVQQVIEKRFASWVAPNPGGLAAIKSPFQPTVGAREDLDTPDSNGAAAVIGMQVNIHDDDPDYPAMLLWKTILDRAAYEAGAKRLGSLELNSTFENNNFGEEGKQPTFFVLNWSSATASALEPMVAALDDAVTKFFTGDLSSEELEIAKQYYQRQYYDHWTLGEDTFIAWRLVAYLRLGRTLEFDRRLNEAIAKLTIEDMKRVQAKGYITADRLVRISAHDHRKVAPPATEPASAPGVAR